MIDEKQPAADVSEAQGDIDAMGAVWDKLAIGTDDIPADEPKPEETEVETPEPEAEETDAEPDAEVEPEAEKVAEPPSDLPAKLKEHWAKLDDDARSAILTTQREMSSRMAEQGRIVSAAKPVYDVLIDAAQKMPSLRDMKPADIARDMFQMAQIGDQLNRDPVNTLLKVAKDYGAIDGVRAALAGEAPDQAAQTTQALVSEIRDLKRQLSQVADPALIEQRVTQTLTARDSERAVVEFAQQAPHWGDVEASMPQFVQIAQARLGGEAPAKAILEAAYDMAIHADPDLRAKVTAAAKPAPAKPDPARVAQQLKAKAVNVVSKSSGATKPLTERQAMGAVWDRYANS